MVNQILNEKELKHDLEVMLIEYKWHKDAFGQHPATSYCVNIDGFVNLRNMVGIACAEIIRLRQLTAEGKVN